MRALLIIALAACGASPISSVRFRNAPPVMVVDDRRDVPVAPSERTYHKRSYHFDSYYLLMTRDRPGRALGVNSLDEVPDSTWFTNRIGAREMSADEIRRGPEPESPEAHLPWTIKKSKPGGTDIGFLVEDARGETFLLKFDRRGFAEVETGADAIVARLLWAAGYNVPADHVVMFRREDLRIAPDAYTKRGGKKQPIDDAFIDAQLAKVERAPDGRIRALASMFIKGKTLGGAPRIGVRGDDPNDRIPHERRRDQRGLSAFLAWLSHTDMKEDNTVDAWQADPANPRIHYVVHYLVDFGWALGVDSLITNEPYVDHRYGIDPAATMRSILSLGLIREPWEDRQPSRLRGIALFSADHYDPAYWKPAMPSQLPVIWADRFDKLWASKILIRFTRDQIAAAVDAARFSDPRSARYMVDTLVARQRITAAHWFRQTSPVDNVGIVDERLCFTDLAILHRLDPRGAYTVDTFDPRGRRVATTTITTDINGRACPSLALADGRDRYTIVRLTGPRARPVEIHVAVAAGGTPRVVGLHRK